MSSRRSMTRDIHESIRLLLGKNTKILLKVPVKLELKGKENRILVFTPHRLFIVTAKVPARVDHNFHYLDIKGLWKNELRRVRKSCLHLQIFPLTLIGMSYEIKKNAHL